MTYRVAVRRSAQRELAEIQRWYEAQRPGLGHEFRQAIDSVFDQLRQTPFLYAVIRDDVRRTVLDRFPYVVYYLVRGAAVRVLACMHTHRDPRLHMARTHR